MEGNTARIERDVISPNGDRLTIFVAKFWRPMLAEFNTHRSHSRSSASSRAIPVTKQLSMIEASPARPVYWGAEQSGMQSGGELDGVDLRTAQALFDRIEAYTVAQVRQYLRWVEFRSNQVTHDDPKMHTLHKSLINRLLEPFMWHTIIFGATDDGWDNFFKQRSTVFSPDAQAEFRVIADQMYELRAVSTPNVVPYGEWVTPFLDDEDKELTSTLYPGDEYAAQKISTARCARVSYLNHEGVRNADDDMRMFNERLFAPTPRHSAPSEFVATPIDPRWVEQQGNFKGWYQFRHLVEKWD